MKSCACPRPQRSTQDRLRCSLCGGWSAAGAAPFSRVDFTQAGEEAASFLENAVAEYAWLEGALYGLQSRGNGSGRTSGPSDPTGALAGSEGHDRARSWAALASRLLRRAVDELQRVDEAVGEARYAIDQGPPVKVDYVTRDLPCPRCGGSGRLAVVPEGREDLAAAHAAKGRRVKRKEDVPL